MGFATELSPYFDKNIIMNFNGGSEEPSYMLYEYAEDNDAVFAQWSEQGMPDIIISEVELRLIYSEEELDKYEYVRVAEFDSNMLFKFEKNARDVNIYMRKDLLDDYPNIQELSF
jgi:hypothetical protein